ncbi:MAG TPA: ferrochelatase [Steroidobacteraceae bacterium]|jgi:ferrochelatase
MASYLGEPAYEHGSAAGLGALLVNLGTPDAPTPAAIRRFLAEFLWDPRVVEAPRWLWWLALHGVILRIRPSRSAHAYRQIWTPEGSPLLLHTRALVDKVRGALQRQLPAAVALGMSYGSPGIPEALEQLRRAGARRLVVLPLYPQYSGTTTASVFDRVTAQLQRWRWVPELRFIGNYHDDPAYIEAIAASIREHWRAHERGHLLFSFHGVPQRYLLAGDPYHCQCLKTARLVTDALGLDAGAWSVSFQSQVGREEWLRPYTDATLLRMAREGQRRVSIVCPGFATDCLETLEEIAIRNRALFLANGGEFYDYIPALNASDAHAAFLADLIGRHARDWPAAQNAASELNESRQRALRQGAAR